MEEDFANVTVMQEEVSEAEDQPLSLLASLQGVT